MKIMSTMPTKAQIEWGRRQIEALRLSHTIANEEECHLCGGKVRNPKHYLCYLCWKAQNRGGGVA